jgi:hypothetical protein
MNADARSAGQSREKEQETPWNTNYANYTNENRTGTDAHSAAKPQPKRRKRITNITNGTNFTNEDKADETTDAHGLTRIQGTSSLPTIQTDWLR